ncbi:hypothetical protein ATK74_1783 [Propionicimonas paludicola]|uniref:Uncharacterized protein n=1 Tax=Propionicimonas paludicola TaxID=185243 RepID=A0A2A9CUC2_9ACTN|nr:hypothetical protein [Propionicimonas paludicola]PFG17220.1 hypothetical protein ATK74_1783 [Propionicimonas paludicola]
MIARQTRIIVALCALFVFVALATVLNAWQEMFDQLASLAGWLPIIGEGLR